jgi:CHAT domain-containing protein
VVCRQLGHYDRALALFDRAQRTYESLGESATRRAAAAKTNRAIVLTMLGEFDAALRLHAEAREVFARHAATVSLIRNDVNVAYVHAGQGRLTNALRLLSDGLELADQAGLEVEAVEIGIDMVECYLALNRNAEALELVRETAARAERGGAATHAARARLLAALAEQRLGNTDQALTLLGEADEALRRAGMTAEVAAATLQRARLHLAEEAWLPALESAGRAAAQFQEKGMAIRAAEARIAQARALAALGQSDEATALALAALATTRERGVEWLAHECHAVLASVARRRGDLPGALPHYRAAVESIEATHSQLANALRTSYLGDKLEAYEGAIECSLALGNTEAAFVFLERAKSRALVDYLARNGEVRLRARDTADQALADELGRLRAEHSWFYSRLYGGLLPGGDGVAQGAEAETLRAGIAERETRIARLMERIALRDDGEIAGVAARSVAPRPALDDSTALVEYFFTRDSGVAFVLTGGDCGRIRTVALSAGAAEIERLLFKWQLTLGATARALASRSPLNGLSQNARTILAALYRALILPVETYVVGHGRLVVVPYGATHAVPFHALFDGRRHLVERMEVSVCPSSSVLTLCAGRPRRSAEDALVVAHTAGGRLPHVLREAEAVAALLPGERYVEQAATRQAVIDAAPRHGVLHLAAHGESRLDRPAFAHVQLADGQLSAADVFNLRLDGALVTLSACETGRAVVTGGDELVGLSRGFLYAGASALVQSLWRVEDLSTARLMERFYGGLRAGQTAGQALRAAQLRLLDETGGHPYLWAPFQLVGDGGWN